MQGFDRYAPYLVLQALLQRNMIMNQLQIHNRIDEFFKNGTASASITVANELIGYNADAKRYFFSKRFSAVKVK